MVCIAYGAKVGSSARECFSEDEARVFRYRGGKWPAFAKTGVCCCAGVDDQHRYDAALALCFDVGVTGHGDGAWLVDRLLILISDKYFHS